MRVPTAMKIALTRCMRPLKSTPPNVRMRAKRQQQAPTSDQKNSSAKSVAGENSSIASETTQIAKDDTSGRKREVGCKTFFPSVGMTLSVPCD
jgi:hypothetical protein